MTKMRKGTHLIGAKRSSPAPPPGPRLTAKLVLGLHRTSAKTVILAHFECEVYSFVDQSQVTYLQFGEIKSTELFVLPGFKTHLNQIVVNIDIRKICGVIFLACSGCCGKILQMDGLYMTDSCFSQFWRLTSPRSRC